MSEKTTAVFESSELLVLLRVNVLPYIESLLTLIE